VGIVGLLIGVAEQFLPSRRA